MKPGGQTHKLWLVFFQMSKLDQVLKSFLGWLNKKTLEKQLQSCLALKT